MTQSVISRSYRDYIALEYARRLGSNPHYSQRAFARDLQVSPATLSAILQKRRGLSPNRAASIAKLLKLGREESSRFVDLVKSEHARSPSARKQAKQRLKRIDFKDVEILDRARSHILADWRYMALIELTHISGFEHDAKQISKQMNMPVGEIELMLNRLVDLGFLSFEDGKFKDTSEHLTSTSGISSESIRSFHKGLIDHLKTAIDTTPPSQRQNEAAVFAVSAEDLVRVQKLVDRFYEDLIGIVSTTSKKTDVYNFSLNLWKATHD